MSQANAIIPWDLTPDSRQDIGLNIDTTVASGKEYAIQLPMVTSPRGNISLSCNLQTVFKTYQEFDAAVNTYKQQYHVYGSHLNENITLGDSYGTCTGNECHTSHPDGFYTWLSVANIKFAHEGAAVVIKNMGTLPLSINNCYLHI